eukprot:CAMPEP_0196660528 /NCGR_PEP_ID=MMETSP1086-20130531/40191_1 /TAXON_ID=77921 /ORGANISM="Cyanoptyche  gloeocystis , Strain SAG4.97" /LENGTH=361 /DNA_ID=CAMNT_0041994981 /DNA_START=36 /DNA_END=1118 /DNA_ORIENTATION=-
MANVNPSNLAGKMVLETVRRQTLGKSRLSLDNVNIGSPAPISQSSRERPGTTGTARPSSASRDRPLSATSRERPAYTAATTTIEASGSRVLSTRPSSVANRQSVSVAELLSVASARNTTQDLMPESMNNPRDSREFLRKGSGVGLSSSQRMGHKPDPPRVPSAGAFRKREPGPATNFRRLYNRGDLPLAIHHRRSYNKINWKVPLESLDEAHVHEYILLFAEGLREKEDPYRFLAIQGIFDLLQFHSSKVISLLPKLIIPIKVALNTRDPDIVCVVAQLLRHLVQLEYGQVGKALVPYLRHILPVFNLFINRTVNTGDTMLYSQQRCLDMSEQLQDTLEAFERYGGRDAMLSIKYVIPTYE